MNRVIPFVLLLGALLFAQNPQWMTYSVNTTGVPFNANTVARDESGNIYIGSPEGLTQFDGTHWRLLSRSLGTAPFDLVDVLTYSTVTHRLYCAGTLDTNYVHNGYSGNRMTRVASFDGQNWRIYNIGDMAYFNASNSGINQIIVDDDGELYLENFGSFYHVTQDTAYMVKADNGLNFQSSYLAEASGAGIWVTANWGVLNLFRYEGGSVDSVYCPIGGANNSTALKEDANGTLWIAAEDPDTHLPILVKYKDLSVKIYKDVPPPADGVSLQYQYFNTLDIDPNGHIWLTTKYYGLYEFDPANEAWHHYDIRQQGRTYSDGQSDYLRQLYVFDAGHIYLIAEMNLVCFNGSTVEHYFTYSNTGLPGNEIYSIFIDANKHEWLADLNHGFARFNGDVWRTYDTYSFSGNLYVATVYDITVLPNEEIYLASSDSLRYFKDGTWHSISVPQTYGNYFTSIVQDKSKVIWLGDENNGLARLDGDQLTFYTPSNSDIPGSSVSALAVAPNNHLWLGFRYGTMAEFDGQSFTTYNISYPGEGAAKIKAIAVDNQGIVWGAALNVGLIKFENGSWQIFTPDNSSLPSKLIYDLAVDQNNVLWMATIDAGLVRYANGNWQTFNASNSPISNSLLSVAVDANNNKWIGNANNNPNGVGVYVYNENGVVVGVEQQGHLQPVDFKLLQNYPNPFNPQTTIRFYLSRSTDVTLSVYDVLGRKVRDLVRSRMTVGMHRVTFDAGNLSSGMYFYRLKAGHKVLQKKMLLLK